MFLMETQVWRRSYGDAGSKLSSCFFFQFEGGNLVLLERIFNGGKIEEDTVAGKISKGHQRIVAKSRKTCS